jgi:WD40 repeat protein
MRRIAYASDMSLAQQALAMDDVGRAQRLLNAHRPAPGQIDLRGWEWRHLWGECRSDALGELCQYPYPVYSVAYSPDGAMLAVAGVVQACVDIWDASGHKRIRTLQPESGHSVAFSPRGDLLATNAKNHIQLWRTSTWDPLDPLRLAGRVVALKFSPEGTRLASLSYLDADGPAGELTVWEVGQWAVVRRIGGLRVTGSPSNLDFSPDGRALVVGHRDCRLQVIDVASGKTIFGVSEAHPEQITAVAWSPDDSVIASGSGWVGGPIRLWDATSGKSLGELEGHTSWITDLLFSEAIDGLRLYSASGDQTIRIWDVAQRRPLAILRGSRHEVLGLALSPDGTTLASACKDGVVAFWSAVPQPQQEVPRLIPAGDSARLVFAPDSRVLAISQAGTVNLFDLATSKEPEQVLALGTDVSTIAYSPDGTLLVSGSEEGRLRVWSFVEHRLLRELDGHGEEIGLLRFRADGTRLFSLDATGRVIGWDALKWRADQTFGVGLHARWREGWWAVDVSPDGRLVAYGARGALHWLSAETGELLETTTGDHLVGASGVAFSSDGLCVASTYVYGTVALWDVSSFGLETAFRGHLLGARGPTFSPDGRRLVTTGTGRDAVRLWDLSSHRELMTLPGKGVFSFVAFSPDGNYLAAYSPDSSRLHLWRAPSWEEIEAEEKRLQGEPSPRHGQYPRMELEI